MKDESAQFVILEHRAAQGIHWDLMLEDAGVLLTWRLESPPERIGDGPVEALRIADHPVRFLNYEGPVQKNTGVVRRADRGTCRWVSREQSTFIAFLSGQVLSGQYKLEPGAGSRCVLSRINSW